MSFTDAVRVCLSKYATFSGRARRSEYWWWVLFQFLVAIAATVVDQVVTGSVVGIIATLAFVVPSLAVAWRRLHDTGRSGAWYFIALVPFVGFIVLLVFMVSDSEPGPQNAYGPSPKYPAAGYGAPVA